MHDFSALVKIFNFSVNENGFRKYPPDYFPETVASDTTKFLNKSDNIWRVVFEKLEAGISLLSLFATDLDNHSFLTNSNSSVNREQDCTA